MRRLGIEEIRQIELDMLICVDAFCRDNNIQYSISAGTLLGAVRHHGFIPWDDDADVTLPREDYDRFINTFNDPTGRFELHCYTRQYSYHRPFARIYDTCTVCEQHQHKMGVYLDVFPLDAFPEGEDLEPYVQKFLQLQNKVVMKRTPDWHSGHIVKEVIKYIAKSVLYPGSRNKYICDFEQFYSSLKLFDAPNAGCISVFSHYGMKEILPSYVFKEYVDFDFEGHTFKGYKHYHEYLSSIYGDYMQLPPESKRNSNHFPEAYMKDL